MARRVSVDADEGVECLVCGDVMRTLSNHPRVHGLTNAEYKRRFPGAPTSSPIFKAIRSDIWVDRIAEGDPPRPDRARGVRQEMCDRGLHALRGRNVYVGKNGRQCRACVALADRERYLRNRDAILQQRREHYLRSREAKRG